MIKYLDDIFEFRNWDPIKEIVNILLDGKLIVQLVYCIFDIKIIKRMILIIFT